MKTHPNHQTALMTAFNKLCRYGLLEMLQDHGFHFQKQDQVQDFVTTRCSLRLLLKGEEIVYAFMVDENEQTEKQICLFPL